MRKSKGSTVGPDVKALGGAYLGPQLAKLREQSAADAKRSKQFKPGTKVDTKYGPGVVEPGKGGHNVRIRLANGNVIAQHPDIVKRAGGGSSSKKSSSDSGDWQRGPRGGRYKMVNGKKQYG